MTTEPSDDRHAFRFKCGSLELAVVGLPAILTLLAALLLFGLLRWVGLI